MTNDNCSPEQLKQNQLLLKRQSIQSLFVGYYYDYN
jgi:hypothetical protein